MFSPANFLFTDVTDNTLMRGYYKIIFLVTVPLALLFCIPEISGSNLGSETGYLD
jgi:MFS-type transporter involved in bile tolerance (Atg22 family)